MGVYKRNCSLAKNIGLGLDRVDNSGSTKWKGKLNRNCCYKIAVTICLEYLLKKYEYLLDICEIYKIILRFNDE